MVTDPESDELLHPNESFTETKEYVVVTVGVTTIGVPLT